MKRLFARRGKKWDVYHRRGKRIPSQAPDYAVKYNDFYSFVALYSFNIFLHKKVFP